MDDAGMAESLRLSPRPAYRAATLRSQTKARLGSRAGLGLTYASVRGGRALRWAFSWPRFENQLARSTCSMVLLAGRRVNCLRTMLGWDQLVSRERNRTLCPRPAPFRVLRTDTSAYFYALAWLAHCLSSPRPPRIRDASPLRGAVA